MPGVVSMAPWGEGKAVITIDNQYYPAVEAVRHPTLRTGSLQVVLCMFSRGTIVFHAEGYAVHGLVLLRVV